MESKSLTTLQSEVLDYETWLRAHPDADIDAVREIRRKLAIAKLEILKSSNNENDNSNGKAGQ